MADIESIFKSKFSSYLSTLKNTSLDDNDKNKENEYLCQNETQRVFNFDKIIKDKYPLKQPSSFDALLIQANNIYCIEFKNSKYSDIKNKEIQKKLTNSKDVLKDILMNSNILKRNYTFIYCVIFKNHPPKWRRGITKNIIQFDLEEYVGQFFDKIYTNDVQFFTNEYKKHFQKELIC